MTSPHRVGHVEARFVESVPPQLEEGVLYVSHTFDTMIHQCCCGCGFRAVTPISPVDWRYTYDGESISVRPSIGNSAFPCGSHYWITKGRIRWVRAWTAQEVARGHEREAAAYAAHFARGGEVVDGVTTSSGTTGTSWWIAVTRWYRRRRG